VADVQVVTASDLLVIHLKRVALPTDVTEADDFETLRYWFVEDRPANSDSDSTQGALGGHYDSSFD
jgi:hypothetical protein